MNTSAIRGFALIVAFFGISRAAAAQPAYYRAGDKRIELQEVKDFAAARVQWDAVVSKTNRSFEQFFDSVESIGMRKEELLLQKPQAAASRAAAALDHLVDIQEIQRLRVFQVPGSKRLLVEFPELIVQFKEEVTQADAEAHIRLYSKTYRKAQIPLLYYVRVANTVSTLLVAEQFWASSKVDYCEPRFRIVVPASTGAAPISPSVNAFAVGSGGGDPLFNQQWALTPGNGPSRADIRILNAWKRTRGDTSVRVAVLDDGIDTEHPDLIGQTVETWDVITETKEMVLESSAIHGTAVAGIIAAVTNNGIGTAGVATGVRLIGIRIASRDSRERWTTDAGWVAEGIDKAVELGAQVLNGSWGLEESENVKRAIQRALAPAGGRRPLVAVFSAGNDGGAVQFPASMAKDYPVIAVGASTVCDTLKTKFSCDGNPEWESNKGAALTLLAPGTGIATLRRRVDGNGSNPLNYLLNFSGTSASAPFVAGTAALMLSADNQLTPAVVKERLRLTGDKITSGSVTYSRLNACRAIGGNGFD